MKAKYTSNQYSEYAISNIVGHLMQYSVTVNVTLSTGLEPINVNVTLQGLDWPYATYEEVTPASGTAVFPEIWKGHYYFNAYKLGYYPYEIMDVNVNQNLVINVVLSEKRYPPTNLYVDPLTLEATWNEPLLTAVSGEF